MLALVPESQKISVQRGLQNPKLIPTPAKFFPFFENLLFLHLVTFWAISRITICPEFVTGFRCFDTLQAVHLLRVGPSNPLMV